MARKELDKRKKNDHDFIIYEHIFYEWSIVQLPRGGKMKKKEEFWEKMGSPRCVESVRREGRKSVRIILVKV